MAVTPWPPPFPPLSPFSLFCPPPPLLFMAALITVLWHPPLLTSISTVHFALHMFKSAPVFSFSSYGTDWKKGKPSFTYSYSTYLDYPAKNPDGYPTAVFSTAEA
ncbi:hypothetical protein GE21DRAFT_1020051 [Neurospora crassa]|nr:hypothetical protein GE21DRAFT_1020051 [Neurospora crassa]